MFEKNALLFWYAVSPVHMGAGTAVGGLIDNPIQREVHTQHPMLAGSGLKGALREVAEATAKLKPAEAAMNGDEITMVFGPKDGDLHAGALSVSDAQIVAFPVRALCTAFVWVTCPTALARLKRLAELTGIEAGWDVPPAPPADTAVILSGELESNGKLVLEAFAYNIHNDGKDKLQTIAEWLAERCLPEAGEHKPFAERLQQHLVLVRDEDFGHFVRFSTSVEPHVRINDDTGTADDGGLFYTENLPPETILASLLLASKSRRKDQDMPAATVLEKALTLIDGRPLQIGGDATTGRGLMVVHAHTAETADA